MLARSRREKPVEVTLVRYDWRRLHGASRGATDGPVALGRRLKHPQVGQAASGGRSLDFTEHVAWH